MVFIIAENPGHLNIEVRGFYMMTGCFLFNNRGLKR